MLLIPFSLSMFPKDPRDGDRSGNCQAGTTIDEGLGHPTEFDYYQLTHGGLLGTSRPAHYSVCFSFVRELSFRLTCGIGHLRRMLSRSGPSCCSLLTPSIPSRTTISREWTLFLLHFNSVNHILLVLTQCKICRSRSATFMPGPLAPSPSRPLSIVSPSHMLSAVVLDLNSIRTP